VLNAIGGLLGIAAIRGVVRLELNDHRRVARILLALQVGWVAGILVFGLNSSLVVAAMAFWCKRIVDSMREPLFNAWQTRVIPSDVRNGAVGIGPRRRIASGTRRAHGRRERAAHGRAGATLSRPGSNATRTVAWNVSPRSRALDPVRRLRRTLLGRPSCQPSANAQNLFASITLRQHARLAWCWIDHSTRVWIAVVAGLNVGVYVWNAADSQSATKYPSLLSRPAPVTSAHAGQASPLISASQRSRGIQIGFECDITRTTPSTGRGSLRCQAEIDGNVYHSRQHV
jgi:hypothetical protein